MNSKNVLLTHFSQRYPKIPSFDEKTYGNLNIGVAFDMMRINLDNFAKLKYFSSALQTLFKE
jgi:ribonuclease Z